MPSNTPSPYSKPWANTETFALAHLGTGHPLLRARARPVHRGGPARSGAALRKVAPPAGAPADCRHDAPGGERPPRQSGSRPGPEPRFPVHGQTLPLERTGTRAVPYRPREYTRPVDRSATARPAGGGVIQITEPMPGRGDPVVWDRPSVGPECGSR